MKHSQIQTYDRYLNIAGMTKKPRVIPPENPIKQKQDAAKIFKERKRIISG